MLSIPYDPALVLGNLVKDDLLNAVLAVSQAAAPADTAQEALNSLIMTAFEDYIDKALSGNVGVPINYYLKRINKAALAHLWVSKYYPQYLAISEDDSGRGGPAKAAPATAAA